VTFELPLSRKDAVVQRLRGEMLSGELAPGAPVKDAELAARLGLSVTPVREAITQLISEGFIEALPNKRRRVAVLTQKQAIDLMDVLGAVLVAGLERTEGRLDHEWLDAFGAAVRGFQAELKPDMLHRSGAAFRRVVELVFDAADNDELRAVMDHVLLRSLNRIQLYPSNHLLPLWGEAFGDTSALLAGGNHAAAIQRLRSFFGDLVAAMRRDRADDAVVAPRPH
jgi:DNA-binding GntR family transcriptional regulator